VWAVSSGSAQGPMAGSCEYGNELSGSIKVQKFFELVNDYQLLKEDSFRWSYFSYFVPSVLTRMKAEGSDKLA
jgi:hypothetical protein